MGLFLVCLILGAYFSIDLVEGVYHGVKTGRDTLTWPSVQGFTSLASLRAKPDGFLPETHEVFLPYMYHVEGRLYNAADFDAAGHFYGTLTEANEFRKNAQREITIYYNPDDPSEAILSPGIVFDPHTRSLFRVVGGALVVAILSLVEFRFFGKRRADNSGELTKTQ